uniref:DNA-3-methyladenine glycosylase I (3-methyladenine-DNA glycosylase I) (TAG I) (DNA-3-methyladenine glycosidase I) n=1 Tax=mine drainage metagenome TaxID=410659 RepID=E6Q288_9ZZZZ
MTEQIVRCAWASSDLSIPYHDDEWGVPSHEDRHLFEMLVLEGAQAGLSWETILRKRADYRRRYKNFDPALVARFGARELEAMMGDAGLVRNRLKLESSVQNARSFLDLAREYGSFARWLWAYVGDEPVVTRRARGAALPASTDLSARISKDLRARGFRFVGPTIVYSYLQGVGVVDDHYAACFRAKEAVAP